MKHSRTPAFFACLLLLSLAGGCGDSTDEQVSSIRAELMLADEPVGALSVGTAKTTAKTAANVVVVGAVDLSFTTVSANETAVFTLREVVNDGHATAKGHNASDCPFCKHEFENAPQIAVVVKDAEGQLMPFSPERLFGISQGDIVVVQGVAEVSTELDLVTVELDHIYKRQREE